MFYLKIIRRALRFAFNFTKQMVRKIKFNKGLMMIAGLSASLIDE